MLEENVSKINNYFDGQISLCVQRRMDLRAEGRMDESVFENVKENVYNIGDSCPGQARRQCDFPGAVLQNILQSPGDCYKKPLPPKPAA